MDIAVLDHRLSEPELVSWRSPVARILPYDPSKGAGYYLCKYLSKEMSDIEFGGLE